MPLALLGDREFSDLQINCKQKNKANSSEIPTAISLWVQGMGKS